MTALTPKLVFKEFDSNDILVTIAEKKGLKLSRKQKKNVVDLLAEETIRHGLNLVLTVLKKENLSALCTHKDFKWGEDHGDDYHPNKSVMVKALSTFIPDYGVNDFFSEQKKQVLIDCCKIIDDLEDYDDDELSHMPGSKFVEAIMQNIYTFGLQNLFSSFSITDLKSFCEDCQLKVKSSSKEILIDCLVEQKNFRKRRTALSTHSQLTKKPSKIKAGLKRVDLKTWFLRKELEAYCKDNGIKTSGTKRDLVNRIYLYLDGERGDKIMARKKKSSATKVKSSVTGVAKRAKRKVPTEPSRRSERLSKKSRDESSSSSD